MERHSPDHLGNEDSAIRPWSPFLSRDFTLLWSASVVATVGSQLRHVINLYQVYALSGSSLKLGLTGFFQALPFILFGLFGGAVADEFDRKKLIVITQAFNLLPGLALGILTATGAVWVWHIIIGVFAQGTNALGAVLAGAVAAMVGAPKAVLVGSALCVVMILAISQVIPQV